MASFLVISLAEQDEASCAQLRLHGVITGLHVKDRHGCPILVVWNSSSDALAVRQAAVLDENNITYILATSVVNVGNAIEAYMP